MLHPESSCFSCGSDSALTVCHPKTKKVMETSSESSERRLRPLQFQAYSYIHSPCGNLLKTRIMKYRLGHIRQVAIWISSVITSWINESSNNSFVEFNKLRYFSRNLSFWKITKRGPTDRPTDRTYLLSLLTEKCVYGKELLYFFKSLRWLFLKSWLFQSVYASYFPILELFPLNLLILP